MSTGISYFSLQCSHYLRTISATKQLWLNSAYNDVLLRGLDFPPYTRSFFELTRCETQALVVMTLKLHAEFSGTECHPDSIHIPQSRSVTWLRLVHGRWLLIALSDESTSSITLWSLQEMAQSEKNKKPLSEFFLPYPVLNGIVSVNNDTLVIALELASA